MTDPPPSAPAPRRMLSLYDNIEDPNDPNPPGTISAAPVIYKQDQAASAEAKKPVNPALLFQPQIRRPQPKQNKGVKTSFPPKGIPTGSATGETAKAAPQAPAKTSLADWAPTQEDEWMYGTGEKRQRGGRKNKKKKQQQGAQTNWDDFYDASKPTSVDEYIKSDEKVNEVLDWKEFLHRRGRKRSMSEPSSDEDEHGARMPSQFAPPPSNSFAPPPMSPPRPPPSDHSGDDAFSRRAAMSSFQPEHRGAPSPSAHPVPPPPPPPPQFVSESTPPPPTDSAVISRAPVRYQQQQPPAAGERDDDGYSPPPALDSGEDNVEEQPRSTRPGQAGFAQRLMSKYGWTQGTGLGANESGIVNPLRVQVEKRRKKADADGGGWAEPGGKGKILGGKRKDEEGRFGKMSEVVVLRNMLENMPDLQSEISNGLGQEIGEECGEKYGRVERLYIDQDARQVFIKFTDQVSALRAVNELDGRVFNGNTIVPKFYDVEKFERGIYTGR
ncbi:G-patch domain-containing protein [Purpureocillium lavendulum]|uniref:G-patch domain-containing protein n=1 Tax=Purpureocillium lavendulum TaxID=1247861 RepID=A0AB34FN01_9HYPO|nr:G-patch domain-containing protein [Purpureocillium lavendulum]